MGAAINDIIELVQQRAAVRRGRKLTDEESEDPCSIESRLEVEDLLISLFGATGIAKNSYRDWSAAVGCSNTREDYDRLLGATGRRR